MSRLLLAFTMALLLGAAPARASVAEIEEVDVGDRFDVEIQEELHVDGEGREANRIIVRRLSRGRYQVRDRGARIHALEGCARRSRHVVVCTPDDAIVFVSIDLGRGDDRLKLRGTSAFARGGSGDDRLTGAGSRDTLRGGPDDDVLRGRGGSDHLGGHTGRDVLAGGTGDDTLAAADARRRPEPDRLLGGPGRDVASWGGAGASVRARLTGDRLRGDRDRGTGIEGLRGASRDDRLVGGERDDRLFGGGGSDVLIGRGGDDRLTPGFASDRDDARCGAGEDRIVNPRRYVFVRKDCELLTDGSTKVRPSLRLLGDGRVEAAAACPRGLLCYLEAKLTTAPQGVPGGSGSARLLAPALNTEGFAAGQALVFELDAPGRALLAGGGRPACVTDAFNGYCTTVR